MNLNFLCCIGAELKNSVQQTTRMTQIYLYRAFEEETIADMLATGFFNDALGIIRQDDLLLLYSPNETPGKYVYARVSSVGRDGVEIEKVNIRAEEIIVDTTGYTNLSGSNLQQILNNLDTLLTTMNNAFVKKDGTSIMSAPLKFVAGSLRGAIGPTFGGVEFYTLNNDSPTYSLVQLGRFTTSAFSPHTDNAYDIGTSARHWKDGYIGRVITSVLNNGFDIAVPVTNSADTLALKSEVDNAANSGRMITDQGVWFAKMYAGTTPPSADDGTNYADFSQTDGEGNPIIVIYERQSGAWVQTQTITPPAAYDGYVPVTKKIWDIVEQTGQNGGRVLWNHQSKQFTPYPSVVSFEDIEITGESTVAMPATPVPQQIVNKDYVDGVVAASAATKANVDMDNLTDIGKNIANWSSNVSNCITEISQDIKLELSAGTLTLKAGSKVYVPNGVDTFDVITVASDISATPTSAGTGTLLLFLTADGTSLQWRAVGSCGSGTTETGTGTTYYNTSTNIITAHNSGGNVQVSFPICVIYSSSNVITSIDQVFNGIGYMGGVPFVLPGVKGLIPDGKNTDGTLKNTSFVIDDVLVLDNPGGYTSFRYFVTSGSAVNTSEQLDYNNETNYNTTSNGNWNRICLATFNLTVSGSVKTITNFNPNYVFHAVDYSNAANLAMPSSKYVDLTLGSSGSSYIAPADGFLYFAKNATAVPQYFVLNNTKNGMQVVNKSASNSGYIGGYIPASKGDSVKVEYNLAGNTVAFRFIYANGAK